MSKLHANKKPKIRLKKGDTIKVLSGKDRNKTGVILQIIPSEEKVLVQGVNQQIKHTKPSRVSQGGVVVQEAPMHISKVAYFDAKNGASKLGTKILEDGKKVRFVKKSGEIIG